MKRDLLPNVSPFATSYVPEKKARDKDIRLPFDPGTIKIEAGIPIPTARSTLGQTKYEKVYLMKVGESFAVPFDQKDRAAHAVCRIGRQKGWKFRLMTVVEDDVKVGRIWRME